MFSLISRLRGTYPSSLHREFIRTCSSPIINFTHQYTEEQENKIIETLNQQDATELNRFALALTRAKRLVLHRKKHGDFKSLNDVLLVEGFGVKVLQTLCQSILNPPAENESKTAPKTRNYNFVSPEIKQGFQKVVGIQLDNTLVSWAGIDYSTNNVWCWNHLVLPFSTGIRRPHENQILEAAYSIHESIPPAEAYVIESCIFSVITQQAANIPVNQQRLQLASMLHVLLNQAAREKGENLCVYFQKNKLWCRLYGTLIGSERVSTQTIIEDMFGGAPGPYSPLTADEELIQNYYKSPVVLRESMGSALLLTTCFLDLNIRKMTECFNVLRGREKSKKSNK